MDVKQCVLYDRECIDCGECDVCDLDPNKICDNCGKCISSDEPYRSVIIDEIILDRAEAERYNSYEDSISDDEDDGE